MTLSADKKTAYYLEFTRQHDAPGEYSDRYAFVALDIATRTTKTIDDNVDVGAEVTKNGQIVFLRSESGSTEFRTNRRLYLRDPNQAEPMLLSSKTGKDVSNFVIDEESSRIFYEQDWKIHQVPMAGGPSKKVTDGWRVDAALKDGLLVRQRFDMYNFVRFDGRKGKEYKLAKDERYLGFNEGFIITSDSEPERLVIRATPWDSSSGATKKDLAIDPGVQSIRGDFSGQVRQIVARYEKDSRVFEVQGAEVKKIFTSTGAYLRGYADIENETKVVLACHDTNGNDNCDELDESDVCFIEGAASDTIIDIPTRQAPTSLKSVAEKLRVLTTDGDLAGAKFRFVTNDDGGNQVEFDSPVEGPSTMDELRARAYALQTRVTEISGEPTLSVRIRYTNGFTAGTEWHANDKRFRSLVGMGSAQLADVKEYSLEIDPKIIFGWESSTCRGKLKNVSDKPLEKLTIECVPGHSAKKGGSTGKGKVSPSTLAPGVEGQYMTSGFEYSEYSYEPLRFVVKLDGQEIGAFNRFVDKREKEQWDQALTIFHASGLVYRGRIGKDAAKLVVSMSPAFQKLDKAEQEKACAKAIDEMVKLRLIERAKSKKAVLEIRDPNKTKIRWRYKDKQLSEVVE